MCTLDQIKEFKYNVGGLIVSQCKICEKDTAWNDYYGNYACNCCLVFFVCTVRSRKDFVCLYRNGMCLNFPSPPNCSFCGFEMYIRQKFQPLRYGCHPDGWYLKDIVPHLRFRRNPASIILEETSSLYFEEKTAAAKLWIRENPPKEGPISEQEMKAFLREYQEIAVIMKIIEDSYHYHDIIYIKYGYYDPYKGSQFHSTVRRLLFLVLRQVRLFQNEFLGNEIPLQAKKNFVYN